MVYEEDDIVHGEYVRSMQKQYRRKISTLITIMVIRRMFGFYV